MSTLIIKKIVLYLSVFLLVFGAGLSESAAAGGLRILQSSSSLVHPVGVLHAAPATWKQVSAGSYYSCAIADEGSLWCWGDNTNGQLGDGTNTAQLLPVQIGSEKSWTKVSAGGYHACAVLGIQFLWPTGRWHHCCEDDAHADRQRRPLV